MRSGSELRRRHGREIYIPVCRIWEVTYRKLGRSDDEEDVKHRAAGLGDRKHAWSIFGLVLSWRQHRMGVGIREMSRLEEVPSSEESRTKMAQWTIQNERLISFK